MKLSNILRLKLIDLTGYYIYKRSQLGVGADLMEDLKNKFSGEINIIFDVGANIGQTAINYADRFPGAKIFSFEPISSTFDKLVSNTKAYKNIQCHRFAFSEKKESLEVKLFDESASFLNSLISTSMNQSKDAATEMIQSETIDGFLNENESIQKIDLLKIDTEGYELPVIKGALESIANGRIKLIYLEVGFYKTDKRHTYYPTMHEFLESIDFIFFGLYEVSHHDIKYKDSYANALYVHKTYIHEVSFS